jgi:hypothetical protein
VNFKKVKILALAVLTFQAGVSFALPIDWNGTFGVDTTLLSDFRRIDKSTDTSASSNGTQEVGLPSGGKRNASWESYIFRLNPNIIINDAATLKGEITSNYARSGRLGDNGTMSKTPGMGNALYNYNTSEGDAILITKLYMELYADSATYIIGRHTTHWGLGAVYNAGENTWDRHFNTRDGITMKIKLGNFHISPYLARINGGTDLSRETRTKEYGISLLYDNPESDMTVGILYNKKNSNGSNPDYTSDASGAASVMGKTNLTITDIYFKKVFGKVDVGVEVPIVSGNLGNVYNNGTSAKAKAKAIIFESNYRPSKSWQFSLFAGQVDGHDGDTSSFDAMYLNPNYQVANILYRYNLSAVADGNQNVYDSYITNTTYVKLQAKYFTEKWTWDAGLIYATAKETAKSGQSSFNHERNRVFNANGDQDKDLGYELDLGFNYKWNNEIQFGSSLGYLFSGDYWGYNDVAGSKNEVKNSLLFQARTSISF